MPGIRAYPLDGNNTKTNKLIHACLSLCCPPIPLVSLTAPRPPGYGNGGSFLLRTNVWILHLHCRYHAYKERQSAAFGHTCYQFLQGWVLNTALCCSIICCQTMSIYYEWIVLIYKTSHHFHDNQNHIEINISIAHFACGQIYVYSRLWIINRIQHRHIKHIELTILF